MRLLTPSRECIDAHTGGVCNAKPFALPPCNEGEEPGVVFRSCEASSRDRGTRFVEAEPCLSASGCVFGLSG
jgi:hypothetical protein